MSDIFNPDFRDFLQALNNNEVEYILVGGYAVIIHGHARTTGDMDLWVNRTETNYDKLVKAFKQFGMPLFDMTKENFLHHPAWDVFRYGKKPVAIDIMVKLNDFDFNESYKLSHIYTDDDLQIRTIHINQLIEAKKIAGRGKDMDDLQHLQ